MAKHKESTQYKWPLSNTVNRSQKTDIRIDVSEEYQDVIESKRFLFEDLRVGAAFIGLFDSIDKRYLYTVMIKTGKSTGLVLNRMSTFGFFPVGLFPEKLQVHKNHAVCPVDLTCKITMVSKKKNKSPLETQAKAERKAHIKAVAKRMQTSTAWPWPTAESMTNSIPRNERELILPGSTAKNL